MNIVLLTPTMPSVLYSCWWINFESEKPHIPKVWILTAVLWIEWALSILGEVRHTTLLHLEAEFNWAFARNSVFRVNRAEFIDCFFIPSCFVSLFCFSTVFLQLQIWRGVGKSPQAVQCLVQRGSFLLNDLLDSVLPEHWVSHSREADRAVHATLSWSALDLVSDLLVIVFIFRSNWGSFLFAVAVSTSGYDFTSPAGRARACLLSSLWFLESLGGILPQHMQGSKTLLPWGPVASPVLWERLHSCTQPWWQFCAWLTHAFLRVNPVQPCGLYQEGTGNSS